jgi:murein DD-endopeptidase MepM/ murein hydrolase activator NlpD
MAACQTATLPATAEPSLIATLQPTIPSLVTLTPTPQPGRSIVPGNPLETPRGFTYLAQSGDTLTMVARHFGVNPEDIAIFNPLTGEFTPGDLLPNHYHELLQPGQPLLLPAYPPEADWLPRLFPDSEVVFSASASTFDPQVFLASQPGYLKTYREYLKTTGWNSAGEVVARVAEEYAINPRLLLTLLEYQCGCLRGYLPAGIDLQDVFDTHNYLERGLYRQLAWAAEQVLAGYYGWREGRLTILTLKDGTIVRLAPELNAGTVGGLSFLARLSTAEDWEHTTDPADGLAGVHAALFGDAWARAAQIEPLLTPAVSQPALELPYQPGHTWSFSSGPHPPWGKDGAWAALDFAPGMLEGGCADSSEWVVAAAPGRVVRAALGVLSLDLDGDGDENTGWALVYVHLDLHPAIAPGQWLAQDTLLGHPACMGGFSTGTHIHLARKYHGEWIPADGALPFVLSGWVVHNGASPYQGSLRRGSQTILASPWGIAATYVLRPLYENP